MAIAVFSVNAMGHDSQFSQCLKAVIPGMDCMESNSFAMGLLHLKIFKIFSTAIFGITALVLIVFSILGIANIINKPINQLALQTGRKNDFYALGSRFFEKYFSWFSLLQKRDPHTIF